MRGPFAPFLHAVIVSAAIATGLCVPRGFAAAAERVGETEVVVRSVYGTVETARQALAVNDPVYWQELIETGDDSAAKLVFLDHTELSTGPNSHVVINEFVYEKDPDARKFVIGVTKGLLRFVTGDSPSSAYQVVTPTAMIGVRGTSFVVLVGDGGATRLLVERGEVVFASHDSRRQVTVRPGEESRTDGLGAPTPPSPPDPQTAAAPTQITAILAIEGETATGSVVAAPEVTAIAARRPQAAAGRAATPASQGGSGCGGC